ncbi:3409_t:CDS:1, partial [Racocetra fulgida]
VAVPQARQSSNSIIVTQPTTDQKIGSAVVVEWNTDNIPDNVTLK